MKVKQWHLVQFQCMYLMLVISVERRAFCEALSHSIAIKIAFRSLNSMTMHFFTVFRLSLLVENLPIKDKQQLLHGESEKHPIYSQQIFQENGTSNGNPPFF